MKTFLRENKLRLILLGVPILCIIVIWNINFYKIWYDHTNWWNLGPIPDATAVKIVDYQPHTVNGVMVLGDDGKIYMANRDIQRYFVHGFPSDDPTLDRQDEIQQKHDYAEKLRARWGFEEYYFHDAKSFETFGYIYYFGFTYATFQIRENGEVWEKHFESSWVDQVRSRVTLYFCLFLILASFAWMKLFVDYEPLNPKPDYSAK